MLLTLMRTLSGTIEDFVPPGTIHKFLYGPCQVLEDFVPTGTIQYVVLTVLYSRGGPCQVLADFVLTGTVKHNSFYRDPVRYYRT